MTGFPLPTADQAHTDRSARAVACTPVCATVGWRFLVHAELVNFVALRRCIGKYAERQLVDAVGERITRLFTPVSLTIVARQVVEFEVRGDAIEDVTGTLDRLEAAFDAPLEIDGVEHRVELLLAAAASPADAIGDVALAEEAEFALVQARMEGERVVRDTTREPRVVDKVTMRRELAQAIARDELFLHYQPKVHLRRQEVTSAEALLRWNHPQRGLIPPNDFISLAEEARLIAPMTLWTIRRVRADHALLAAKGYDLTLFVNISGQLLNDVAFLEEACRLVTQGDAKIGFEITETSVIRDPDAAIANLQRVAKQGVPISIDDYGAGLSSLAYLKKLPATELKIDKMFVIELMKTNRDPLIVRSTIDLAHAMEMDVTAEGVESAAALALLTVMGCDMVQGFLISRPLPLSAFVDYLDSGLAAQTGATAAAYQRSIAVWKAA